jgi:hypothetical protein
MMSIDYPNYRMVGPWEINKSLSIPTDIELKKFINKLLKSDIFIDLVNKYNIRLLIAGSAYDEGIYNKDKIFTVFIVNAKSKTIAKQLTIRWSSSFYGIGGESSYEIITSSCQKVYKTILSDAKLEIERILQQK